MTSVVEGSLIMTKRVRKCQESGCREPAVGFRPYRNLMCASHRDAYLARLREEYVDGEIEEKFYNLVAQQNWLNAPTDNRAALQQLFDTTRAAIEVFWNNYKVHEVEFWGMDEYSEW